MTRKEELHRSADALVFAILSQVDGDGEMGIGEKELRNAIGSTNLSVIKLRLEEAHQALKETP